MGSNYYARIIPSKERKKQIKKAIDKNDFDEIKRLVNITYSSPEYDYEEGYTGGEIHLGKRSGGWKFLWNPNHYKIIKGHTEWEEFPGGRSGHWVDDGYDVFKYYDLTKKSIKEFIFRKDIQIYDEYGEKQNKRKFWNMALNWGYEKDDNGSDGETYEKWEMEQNPSYTPRNYANEYSRFIEECGFKVNKYATDFYSDGLRFATSTEFS